MNLLDGSHANNRRNLISCCFITLITVLTAFCRPGVAQSDLPPPPPKVPVKGYFMQDFHSGKVLAELNADDPLEPASITKLMTAYIVYKQLAEGGINLTDQVTVSEKAWRMEGSRTFIEVNTQVSVEDLIMGMVVQSGNDATVALAEYVAGSEDTFVELMNREAERLGLAGSHFVNSTGLPDPEHYMTARDIATLARAIIKDFPEQYTRYSTREFTYNDITQHNRNRLLWTNASVDGVKTGYTRSAGYCLSASAKRGDTRLISVVLGANKVSERFSATESLFNYGFRFFETHRLYEAGQALGQVRVWKGDQGEVDAGAAEDLYVTVPKGRYEELKASLNINSSMEAPVRKGVPIGNVKVALGDETLAEAPLVALQDVAESGFVGRFMDGLMMTVSSWFD